MTVSDDTAPEHRPPPDLATASYSAYRPEMGVACRITLGRPPRWFEHPHEHLPQLAPPGHAFHLADTDWPAFRTAYRHKLHRQTAPRLQRMFDDLSRKHGGRRLVLLCFCSDTADCHRGLWSTWWREQTGQEVPEIARDGELLYDSPQPSLWDSQHHSYREETQ